MPPALIFQALWIAFMNKVDEFLRIRCSSLIFCPVYKGFIKKITYKIEEPVWCTAPTGSLSILQNPV